MSRVAWGILSTANIGVKRVIPAILAGQRGTIAAIASRDAARAAGVAARFGIPRSYGTYEALLQDPMVEAVYNPLPNHLHVEWTVKALEEAEAALAMKVPGIYGFNSVCRASRRSGSRRRDDATHARGGYRRGRRLYPD